MLPTIHHRIVKSFRRKPVHFTLNLVAVGVSLTFFIVISVYIFNEFLYDRHHDYARQNRLVRLTLRVNERLGTNVRGALSPPPMGRVLQEENPDLIQAVARCRRKDTDIHYGSPIVQSEMLAESEPRFYWADPTIFDVFTIPFLAGDPKTALVKPDTIAISRSSSRKYFGDADPMGKVLTVDNHGRYTVTGVYEDFPANTHLHMDFIATLESVEDSRATYFIKNNYFTYVALKPGVTVAQVDEKLMSIVNKYVDADLRRWMNFSLEDMHKKGNYVWFIAQPVLGIHLLPHDFEAEPGGNAIQTKILFGAALAILLLSSLNFAGLLIAIDSVDEALGMGRALRESTLLVIVALGIAVILSSFLLPFTKELRADGLAVPLFKPLWLLPVLGLIAIGVLSLARLLSLVLARLSSRRQTHLRLAWTAAMFVIASALSVAALSVGRQINYMQSKELGFNSDQVVVLKEMDGLAERMQDFKADLRANPAIVAASDSATLPGRQFRGKSHSRQLKSEAGDFLTLWQNTVDPGFADAYGLKVVEGRFFSYDKPDDIHGAVINQTAARLLGLQLGTTIYEHSPGTPYEFKVIGVIEDFHVASMRREIPAVTFKLLQYQPKRVGRFVSVRFREGQFDNAMAHITSVWKKYFPERTVEYIWFNDEYARLLAPELRTFRLLCGFAALSFIFACWSLLGLTLAARATIKLIVAFAAIGQVPGVAIGYWLAHAWLSGFFYRVEFSSWPIVVTVVTTVGAAWLIAVAVIRRPRRVEATGDLSPILQSSSSAATH